MTNYITGLDFDAQGNHGELYKKYWPADVHVIGKDIIRFHTIYWPIFLMAMGEPLPKQVFGHPWLLQEGGKMSKSKGNVLYADDLASVFGVDAVRYYVLDGMPFDNDGLVSWTLMTEKINAELANVYGNLVKRTISMTNKYFGGIVEKSGAQEPIDDELKNLATSTYKKVCAFMDECKIADAIDSVFTLLRRANKYIDETAPWILAKDEATLPRLKEVMYNLTEVLVMASSMLEPFMPSATKEVLEELNTESRDYDKLGEFGLYPNGNKVTEEPKTIFARLDVNEVLKKADEIAQKYLVKEDKKENKMEKLPEITIEDFAKIQFKTALVTECVKVEKSKKLLKLTLKVGDEVRTVASGIAEYYTPEEMVGKKVVLVYNLKPAKLCGVESQGMILCAEKDGKVKVVSPEDATLADGATVR